METSSSVSDSFTFYCDRLVLVCTVLELPANVLYEWADGILITICAILIVYALGSSGGSNRIFDLSLVSSGF